MSQERAVLAGGCFRDMQDLIRRSKFLQGWMDRHVAWLEKHAQ